MSSLPDQLRDAEEARQLPPGLWERLKADPIRAPEHLALAAAEYHGPAAEKWLADKQARYAHDPLELARMAKRKHATYARFSGAATGVGGIVTVLPDLAAAAWIQSRVVFFIAAAYGFDPRDPMRPAELLVMRDYYATPQEARRALDGAGQPVVEAYMGSRLAREEVLAMRLAKMVGIRAVRRFAGRLIPGFAIAWNAIGNERRTREVADLAIRYYGGPQARP
jgi:EcsC protein family